MDEKLLQTFLAVAETRSFHRAAKRLHVTQAAISARIRVLEDALDVALFERGPGGTRQTEAGQKFRPQAEQLLAQWGQIKAGLGRQFSNRIALRLGCQLSIWDALLVDLTIWAEDELGKLPLSLNFDHDSNALELLRNGVLDLVITHEAPAGQMLEAIELPAETLQLVASFANADQVPDLPLFLNLQLGADYDAAVREQLGDRSGHLFLGNVMMAVRYLKHRRGMAYLPAHLTNEFHQVSGYQDVRISKFAVYNPSGPAAELVQQMLPGLQALTQKRAP